PSYSATLNNLAAGNYTIAAVATDNSGAKATNTISISVIAVGDNEPPSIITQPLPQNTQAGATMSYHVAASGTQPLSYQWYFSQQMLNVEVDPFSQNIPITGATNQTLTLSNL